MIFTIIIANNYFILIFFGINPKNIEIIFIKILYK